MTFIVAIANNVYCLLVAFIASAITLSLYLADIGETLLCPLINICNYCIIWSVCCSVLL